jgi:CheY-like chemotaxis protein
MDDLFRNIEICVPEKRFRSWEHFMQETPEYSIGLEVVEDTPGHRGHWVHFDHHDGVIREVTMSAAMQAYIAVRQGRLMERWLRKRRPVKVYVWNADQDVCLSAFVLEYHEMLERAEGTPLLRWIVQYNNKIDVCGGLYPVNLAELVRNHFTWVFEPYRQQRRQGKMQGDEALIRRTIRQVCDRLLDLIQNRAGIAPITAEPEILHNSPYNFVIADEKGDPASRLVLAAQGHTNLISLVCRRANGRYTYSIIRGSPYDEDIFQVGKLVEAFQAAEDRQDVRIWGGSNLAAGSDSETGSSLHWTRIRDIAEDIVREAYLESMATTAPALAASSARPRVLLAAPPALQKRLGGRLAECGAEILPAATCGEAQRLLESNAAIDAVVSTLNLPDGGFHCVLEAARRLPSPPATVVCLERADGGATDVLEEGAFQLLVEPFETSQIRRTLADALAQKRLSAS